MIWVYRAGGQFPWKDRPKLCFAQLFERCDSEVHHHNESYHHEQLNVRVQAETFQQIGILIIKMLSVARLNDYVDDIGCAPQLIEFVVKKLGVDFAYVQRAHRVHRLRQAEIAVHYDVVGIIGEKNGDVGVAFDYAEEKIDVRAVNVGITDGGYFFGGIGPNLHSGTFLSGKILDKRVGIVQKHTDHCQGNEQKNQGAVTSYVVDVHTLITIMRCQKLCIFALQ